MPVTVPDYVLTVERSRLAGFFLLFSRFEFALKAAGFAKAGCWGAEVDWNKFSQEIGPKLLPPTDSSLKNAIGYLEESPPKQQKYENGGLSWEPRPAPQSYSQMRALVFFMQGVRNNLMHGAKFLEKETTDPERDLKLLNAAECVVSACLAQSAKAYHAFDSEAL